MKRGGYIKQRSPKKNKRNQLYEKNKKELWEELQAEEEQVRPESPCCQKCHLRKAEELHHVAGRSGVLLWHKPFLRWICHPCHRWVHENPDRATDEGWIVRLNRNEYETIRAEEEIKLYE